MKTFANLFISLILFFSPLLLSGSHIIGGTASYQLINISDDTATLRVEFHFYGESNSPAGFDENILIGLYGNSNEEYSHLETKNVTLALVEPITFEGYEDCPLDQFNYSRGLYTFQIDIPKEGYDHFKLAYLRCCRDASISNILFPLEVGIAITLDIYPKAFEFQDEILPLKPTFPVQSEPGISNIFDISLEDEFDKEYYLSIPKAAGGQVGSGCQDAAPPPILCLPEYDDVEYYFPESPYGIGAELNLDKLSGILNVNIPETSRVLVAITLDRFADDELVCRARQQFVINNFNCSPLNTKDYDATSLAVWPNPAGESIQFNLPLKQVSLYTIGSHQESISKDDNYVFQINTGHLSAGIYFLRGLTHEGIWVSKKIVIMN